MSVQTGDKLVTVDEVKAAYDSAMSYSEKQIVEPSSSFPIPASGSSISYNLSGLTSNHKLILWNFSVSAENTPPVNLTCNTYNGYFTIINNGGTTSESIRPVFALPKDITITTHT